MATREAREPLSARAGALRTLLLWDRSKRAYIEDLLDEYLRENSLAGADRAFAANLCYGVVRHRNTLRAVAERFVRRPLSDYPRSLRMALAIGLYQWLYLRTPAHAAVSETIEMWQELARRGETEIPNDKRPVGLLNGCLREVCRSSEHLDEAASDASDRETIHTALGWVRVRGIDLPARDVKLHELLGIKYSHPPEMVRVWLERMSEEQLLSFLRHNNRVPPAYLVVRRGASAEALAAQLGADGVDVEFAGEEPVIAVRGAGAIDRLPGFAAGEFWVQDITSRKLALLMPERAGASLLDLCASPGGKLIALLDRGGVERALACDVSEAKLRRVAENLERLHFPLDGIEVLEVDEDPRQLRIARKFDQILVDAPCSNTGVLARRHEARWRLLPENIRQLARVQAELLRAATRLLNPRGHLLYTTCSIEPAENREVVHGVLRASPELRLIEEAEYNPGDAPGDGGYGALLERRG
ncbi:MAG: hypothetical protein L0Z55_09245 [Planctomycetes bacterium]|nr:hypothetical protein [Planctomycetota bacterium]